MTAQYHVAVLADVHGNLPAFDAVLADLEQESPIPPDAILVAGDITCGPGEEAILRRLRDRNAVLIHGNADQGLARLAAGSEPEYVYRIRQFTLVRWAQENLSPEMMNFLQTLPEQRVFALPGAEPMRMMHGSPRCIDEPVLPARDPARFAEALEEVPEPVLIFGHTHTPWQERRGSRLAFNPGAVNFPENGWIGAQYALLHWDGERWAVEHRMVSYDLEALRQSYVASGLLDTGPLARVILESTLTGRDSLGDFFRYAGRLAEAAGYDGLPYLPDDIWDRASETFEWQMERKVLWGR